MCPMCNSDLQIDVIGNIAGKNITQFVEKCTVCNYRISIIEFEEDIEEDLF